MKVIVASRNPVKINAVTAAFRACFAGAELDVSGIRVASGVRDQPTSDAEALAGARNRVGNARREVPGADYWVGLEGGTEVIDDSLLAFAWMAIGHRDGRVSSSRSASLPLPPAIRELLQSGMELGEANDRVFATVNSKQAGGAFGLLTGGRYTRESIYTEALELALVPFLHPLFDAAYAAD